VTDAKLMREFIDSVSAAISRRRAKILYLYYGLEPGQSAHARAHRRADGRHARTHSPIRERAFESCGNSPDGHALSGFWTFTEKGESRSLRSLARELAA